MGGVLAFTLGCEDRHCGLGCKRSRRLSAPVGPSLPVISPPVAAQNTA